MLPPMPPRRPGALALLGLVVACSKSEPAAPPPPPLDQPVAAGETRAGRTSREAELLVGPLAKGVVGDYKLYNDKVAFVIADVGHGAGYHPYGGTILDADRVRASGPSATNMGEVIIGLDLLIVRPLRIEVVDAGGAGKAARVRVVGEEAPFPLFDVLTGRLLDDQAHGVDVAIDYVLEPGTEHLRIEMAVTARNDGAEIGGPLTGFLFSNGALPFVPAFGYSVPNGGAKVPYFAAVDTEVSYLYGRPDAPLNLAITRSGVTGAVHGPSFTLGPRQTERITHYLVVGDGNLAATEANWRKLVGSDDAPARLQGVVRGPGGEAIAGARVHAIDPAAPEGAEYVMTARSGADGRFELSVPSGRYRLRAELEGRRLGTWVEADAPSTAPAGLELEAPGRVRLRIRDASDRPLPAKVSFRPDGDAPERLPARFGPALEPGGVVRTAYVVDGEATIELPPGRLMAWFSRGLEYTVVSQAVEVVAGQEVALEARLERVVDTAGWMSTDTHIHSQLSPDSPDLFDDKVRMLVVEGLELPISTEHEAIGDFNPSIERLGLGAWMRGVVGSEITTFSYGHFNAWPLVATPGAPGNGRIDWIYKAPGETFAAIRANAGQPFIQVNHPRSPAIGGYFSALGYEPGSGSSARPADWSTDFDGIEVANGCGVSGIESATMPDWFSFLDRGVKKVALGSSDSHKARGGELGFPRTYLRMPTDDPAQAKIADFRRASFEGRAVVTCGPFLEARVGEAEIGDVARVVGGNLSVWARVAAPDWMDVDQLELVVGGQVVKTVAIPETDAVERFSGVVTASITPGRDAWMIVKVRGNRAHSTWARSRPSFAFTNAIYLDGDGDGAWTMR